MLKSLMTIGVLVTLFVGLPDAQAQKASEIYIPMGQSPGLSFVDREFLGNEVFSQLLERAIQETNDSIEVLTGGGLHPIAVAHLREALRLTKEASEKRSRSGRLAQEAILEQQRARDQLVEP